MPRYARVSNESYESAANAGASELNRIREESIRGENEKRVAAYERMHLELERAKQERQMVHDQAQTERRLKYEYRVAEAIPKLYAIDPADPKAQAQRAQIAKDYPDLFHKETGIPNITQEFEQHQRLSESAQRQRDAVDARKEAADARREGSTDLQQQRQDFAKEMAGLHAELKAKAGPTDAMKVQYQKASEKLSNAQKQRDGTQAFIDEIEKKGENATPDEQARLIPLQKSLQKWQSELDSTTGIKTALESVHPELATPPTAPGAAATPALATEGDRPPPEPEPTGDEAAPVAEVTPLNPNLAPSPPVAATPPVVAVPLNPAPVTPVIPPIAAPPIATPHPYEGKRVLQKSTGKFGTFTNGQFVAE